MHIGLAVLLAFFMTIGFAVLLAFFMTIGFAVLIAFFMHIGFAATLIAFLLWMSFWELVELFSAKELCPLPENQRAKLPPAPPKPTMAQRRVALQLGLDPDRPESWPHETIDDLVRIKRRDGNFGLVQAMRKLTTK